MSEPIEQSATPHPGDVIDDKYRCERVIGQGGMGAVVQATHLLRQAPVALKFMSAGAAQRPEFVERFVNEAVAASRIDSEHVVKIFDVSKLPDGTPYLVMEYLEGEELGGLLAREGSPGLESCPRAVHFALQVLRALQVAHGAGIIHRDMKPANCFVTTRDEEPDFVKVIDFGISKIEQADSVRLTKTHAVLGTPLYMAPEQVRAARRADLRTDLYATGLILYELLSGRTPFYSEDSGLAGLFAEVLLGDPTPLGSLRSDLPDGLAEAVHKALARDPDDRYQSAVEMADALAPFADDRSTEVLRRLWRRAGRGVESSLRPPPGVSLPAIGSAVLRPPGLPGSSGWGEGAGVGTRAATSPSVPPPRDALDTDLSRSDLEPQEPSRIVDTGARTASSPASAAGETAEPLPARDLGGPAAVGSVEPARGGAPSEVGDSAAALTATAADDGAARRSGAARWVAVAGVAALAAAGYFAMRGSDASSDGSPAVQTSPEPTTSEGREAASEPGAEDGSLASAEAADGAAPRSAADVAPSGREGAPASTSSSDLPSSAPTSPPPATAASPAAPSAPASAPNAPTGTATRPKALGEIDIER